MYAKIISILSCLVSIMTLTSCASYQPSYSHSSDPSHVYSFDNGNAAGFTMIKDITYSTADWPQLLAAELYLPKKLSCIYLKNCQHKSAIGLWY